MFLNEKKDLRIAIISKFSEEASRLHESHWEYSIFIENNRASSVEVINKNLYAIYADGSVHNSFGSDVKHEITVIEPGAVLEYKSYATLSTHSAIVKGHYVFLSKGEEFHVEIPTFSLDNPYKSTSLN